MAARRALVIASYAYADGGLRQLVAPAHDAEAFAAVLKDPEIAGFDVTTLINEPHYVVGEAIADFYNRGRRDDLTLLYFTGHGLKDDEGRLYLAMTNTRRESLMFTAISAAQLNDAMETSPSRRKVLILDCCYSGAFPAGRAAKADEGVHTVERFQGKGRAVLTASDATQYAFEGDDVRGSGTSSVFTRYLIGAIRSGEADLDNDGDIALDELYSYVYDRVVAEMPQQRPKKQEDVDGRIFIARNVHWTLPSYLRVALENPIATHRLAAIEGLTYLHRVGNDIVRAAVAERLATLANDDSRSVSAAAAALLQQIQGTAPAPNLTAPFPSPRAPAHEATRVTERRAAREAQEGAAREAEDRTQREVEQAQPAPEAAAPTDASRAMPSGPRPQAPPTTVPPTARTRTDEPGRTPSSGPASPLAPDTARPGLLRGQVRSGRARITGLVVGMLVVSLTAVVFALTSRQPSPPAREPSSRSSPAETSDPAVTGQPLTGHTGFVESVAFGPDGTTLASGSSDHTIRLWEVGTGQAIGDPLTGHTDEVESVAFSPDGTTLASGSSDRTIRLWGVGTGQAIGEPLTGHADGVLSVAFSPDGRILASGSGDHPVRLWDVASRQPLGDPLAGHTWSVTSVAFSPDGRILASGSGDETVRLWDVASRQPLGDPLTGHTTSVSSVAFSPDGTTLASGSLGETIRLWDVASQRQLGDPLNGHTDEVWSVAFSPDGTTLASGSRDYTIRLWDVASQQQLGPPLTHETPNSVNSVAFSPDGKTLASGSRDYTIRLWDVTNHGG